MAEDRLPSEPLRTAVVVGAGIAGLTTGYLLSRQGVKVTVLEAKKQVGGRMTTDQTNTIPYNTGARLVYSFSDDIIALANELGIGDTLMSLSGSNATILGKGWERPATMSPTIKALANAKLGRDSILGFGKLARDVIRYRGRADPNDLLVGNLPETQTHADYFKALGLADFAIDNVDPIFRGARGWKTEQISPVFFLSTAGAMVGADQLNFERGIGQLARTLAQQVGVKVGAKVRSVSRSSEAGPCLVQYDCKGAEERIEADVVVMATEGSLAQRLLESSLPEEQTFFEDLEYNPYGVAHYVLHGQHKRRQCFVARETGSALSIFEVRETTDGRSILSCYLTPECADVVRTSGLQEDFSSVLETDFAGLLGEYKPHLGDRHFQWIENMLPVLSPNYIQRLRRFREWQESSPKRVYFAGDYMTQPLTGGACRSAKIAVRNIARHWGLNAETCG